MVIIIGAGISGLTVGHHLDQDYMILEKENYIGGLSTQYQAGDYRFDFGGHYFHFQGKPGIQQFLSGYGRFKEYVRKSKVFILDRFIPFPIQYHLSYLPAQTGRHVLAEILERTADSKINKSFDQTFSKVWPPAGAGTGAYPLTPGGAYPLTPGGAYPLTPGGAYPLEQYLEQHFGPTLVELFFKPFMGKYYGRDLKDLAADMDKGSIPVPNRETAEQGAAGKNFSGTGYNPVFYYPRDSLAAFIARYAVPLNNNSKGSVPGAGQSIRLNEEVVEINIDQRKVVTTGGTYHYDHLVNTMPLKRLLSVIRPSAQDTFPSPGVLQHISTLVCNVVLEKRRKRWHWLYLPERKFPFYRAGFYPGHSQPVAYLERTVPTLKETEVDMLAGKEQNGLPGQEQLRREILFTLKETGMIESEAELVYFHARYIPVSYVLFDHQWRRVVPPLLEQLKKVGIYSTGRYGSWNYSSMSDDVKAAMETAAALSHQ